ncbi:MULTISPECIES: hypothetical protein [Actinoalloteichus]|uniref:hypothetical protein n=1 Tax=Actinoalloteichus TaxID=65496 RepID=UPI0012FC7877|nr:MULTISPECIES: hypothetical protein [Actinoalloteichus]
MDSRSGRPESLVLVADRRSRSVTLAIRGHGLASVTVDSLGVLLGAVATERPSAAIAITVVGRDHRAWRLHVAVLGPQAVLTLASGAARLPWRIPRRAELASALTRTVHHLTGEPR